MKIKMMVEKEFDAQILEVKAKVRYWTDSVIDDVEDVDGDRMPCRVGNNWCPEIDINTGIIKNWIQGVKAEVFYNICGAGIYRLVDVNGETVVEKDGYVPDCLAPKENGYGNYIIMDIDENGQIQDWGFTLDGLIDELEEN